MKQYLATARKDVLATRPLLRRGVAAVEIERAIREQKPDLVVLGTHGRVPAGAAESEARVALDWRRTCASAYDLRPRAGAGAISRGSS